MRQLIIFLFLAGSFLAQKRLSFTEFRLGTLSPKDSEAGFYGTISSGQMLDANLAYNLELGYFGKRRSNTTSYKDSINQVTSVTTTYTESLTMIPVLAKFNFVKDIGNLLFKADIGVGYAFLWESSEDFETSETDSRHFNGFIWQFGADAGIQLSETGSVFAGLFYNGGTLTGNARKLFGRLPTVDEKNMSGLGFRLTIRVDGLGLL
ncbi:MAG: outer membrane beta-barrel protein [Calditrichaeota bacterium]|nr:outer membrane beta-barrel protein [Calditrichota bacterium]